MKNIISIWKKISLIRKLSIGVVLGLVLGLSVPQFTMISLLGNLFVGALKAIAPLLVLTLVAHALSQAPAGQKSNMRTVICLYLFGTFAAAFIAVGASYLFPIKLVLSTTTTTDITPPQGISEVFQDLLLKIVDNLVNALATANYIGVLTWAAVFGLAFRRASKTTKDLLKSAAEVTSKVVGWIIGLAPFGIMGLVFDTIANNGLTALKDYGLLLLLLVGSMFFVALVVNTLIAFFVMKKILTRWYLNVFELVGLRHFLQEVQQLIFLSICSSANV